MNAKTGLLMAVKQVELPSGDSNLDQRKKTMLDALESEIKLLRRSNTKTLCNTSTRLPTEAISTFSLSTFPVDPSSRSFAIMVPSKSPWSATLFVKFSRVYPSSTIGESCTATSRC